MPYSLPNFSSYPGTVHFPFLTISSTVLRISGRAWSMSVVVSWSNGRADWMLSRVALRSLISAAIFCSVALACSVCRVDEASRRSVSVYGQGRIQLLAARVLTALPSKASMALICAETSYVTGLNSLMIFSAWSTTALFYKGRESRRTPRQRSESRTMQHARRQLTHLQDFTVVREINIGLLLLENSEHSLGLV